ncbi:MAG: hypothetical protein JXM70_08210 [Pirellulales bacterium]|nr:hypothetical protein [Pirellulales bacterium]
MNSSNSHRKEIIVLAEAFFEGTLDEEQAARLDRLVCEDAEAARLYMEYVELHGELHHMHQNRMPGAPIFGNAPDNTADDPLKQQTPSAPAGSSGMVFGWLGLGAITLAAGLLAATTLWWTYTSVDDKSQASFAVANNRNEHVAQLTTATDCCWRPTGNVGNDVGSKLKPGDRLSFDSGTIEVTHDSGAKVRLVGPAAYVVSGANRGLLEEGDLSASVPPEAIGFVIDTPAGQIIDQGTEFDVALHKDTTGDAFTADVKVTKGAVDIAMPKNVNYETVRSRFKDGQAARISSIQHSGTTTAKLDLKNFNSSQDGSFDPRTIKGMRIWLRADAAVMRDKQGRVTEILDLVGGSNKKAENFRQEKQNSRPLWLDRGLNGRSTLTFSGRQYLRLADRSELCFYDESLTIFVVAKASDNTQYFISSQGTLETSDQTGFRFTTSRDCGLRYMAGRTVQVIREFPITRHNVLSAIHDRRIPGKNTVALFCNGRQLGQIEPVPDSKIENSYPLTIGGNPESIHIYPDSTQNFLHGDLAEIILFDRVLSELEQQRIESYLMTRYDLHPSPPQLQ